MLEPNRYPSFDPVRVSTAFLGSSYSALKAGEATLFALAPLPLQHIKTGIQQVAVPLLVTAGASRIPGVDHLIGSAIHHGGHFIAAGGKAIAANGLSSFGNAVSHHLPSGMGIRYAANGIGQAVTPVLLNGVDRGGRVLGELSTGILTGRTLLNAAQQVSSQIGSKGIKVYIGDTVANLQAAITKTKAVLAQAKSKVSQLLKGESRMAKKDSSESGAQSAVTEQKGLEAVGPQGNGKQPEPQYIAPIHQSKPGLEPEMVPAPKSSREAEDYALGIVQSLDQRRLNVERLQIDVNGKTVFKMKDGDIDQSKTSITNEQTELIKKALSDPASLKGSLKISQGNQVLLHVKDGRVLIDGVGLSKQSAKVEVKTPESPSQGLYERFSQGVKPNGLQATKEIATNALKGGVKREQVMDMLKVHDPSYQNLTQAQGAKVAGQTLEKMVDAAEVKLMQEQMPQEQQSQQVKSSKSLKV